MCLSHCPTPEQTFVLCGVLVSCEATLKLGVGSMSVPYAAAGMLM